MTISRERAADFEAQGTDGIKRWLRIAAERYVLANSDRWAWAPFELFIGTRDSLASAIEAGYRELSPTGQSDFRDAVAGVVGELDPRPEYAEMWRFLIELAWLLPAPAAVKVMEIRFTDSFFDAFCETDVDLFHEAFTFISNTAATGPEAECLIGRMAESNRFDFHYARHALLRLCEVAPDHWTDHLAITRDKLHELFRSLRDEGEQAQDELAADVLAVIGFDRLATEFANEHTRLDLSPVAWWERPSDIWLWRALVERLKIVMVPNPPVSVTWIALAARPSDRRALANIQIAQEPAQQQVELPATDVDLEIDPTLVDSALGPAPVVPDLQDA
jgi:hypothetical protein